MMLAVLSTIAALLCIWSTYRRWRLRQRLSPYRHEANWHLWLSALCILTALICIYLGSRPLVGSPSPCILFALDCSESMLAESSTETRLAEGKNAIRAMANRFRHCELALVTYAGDAFVDCPPTRDRTAFETALTSAAPGALYLPGSAPDQAIRQGMALEAGVVILVSDGEMNPPDPSSQSIWLSRESPLIAIVCGEIGKPKEIPRPHGVLYDDSTGRPALTTPAKEELVTVATLSQMPFGGVFEASHELDSAIAFLQKHLASPPASPSRYLLYAILGLLLALGIDPLVRWLREVKLGSRFGLQATILGLSLLFSLLATATDSPAPSPPPSEQEIRASLQQPRLTQSRRARLHSNLSALLCKKALENPENAGRLAQEAVQSAQMALHLDPGLPEAAVNLELAQRLLLQEGASPAPPQAGDETETNHDGQPQPSSRIGKDSPQKETTGESSFGTWRDLRESAAKRQLRSAPQGVKPW